MNASGLTTLPLTSDSLGKSFVSPAVGQSGKWLLNVAQAGDYALTLQTPTTFSGTGRVSVSTSDLASLGTFSFGGATTNALTTLSLHAGLNTLAITTLSPFTTLNLTLTPKGGPVNAVSGLTDTGFETVQLAAGVYFYNAQGSPWNFSGQAGLTTNGTGFTQANPNAPEGRQVAFLQNRGSISQTFNINAAGSYQLLYSVAQRANFGTQSLQILMDDHLIGDYTTSGTAYKSKMTSSFALTPGSHLLTFKGVNKSGEATAFLDNLKLVQNSSTGTGTPPVASAATFADAGFETNPAGSGFFGFVSAPTGSAWNFTGQAGVSANKTAFTQYNPSAPEGRQVAFLQNQGSISQTINNLAAGTYHIDFAMAQRTNWTNTPETFQVLVDKQVVGTYTTSGGTYQSKSSGSVTLGSGRHTFTFQGLNSSGDSTVLLDNISLVAEGTSSPGTPGPVGTTRVVDAGFESEAAGSGYYGFKYAPRGSAWTFTGQSGVSANKTAFTAGNPSAPEGKQVGFVQGQGVISQVVNIPSAGNYRLSFLAAQRANYSNQMERIQVRVDGKLVMTYDITSRAFTSLTTPVFALATGSHVISFKGVTSVGDATAFLDAISLTRV